MPLLLALLAVVAALFSYQFLEGSLRRHWVPAACRAAGWAVIALLLFNAACPAAGSGAQPVVLLDASLSMGAAGGRWSEALALARNAGEVRLVGALGADSLPMSGRSLLAPAIAGAGSGGRRVIVITDGEIEDADAIPTDVLALTSVRVLERRAVDGVAMVRVEGGTRVTPTDTLRLAIEVESSGRAAARTLPVTARAGDRVWLRGSVTLDGAGRGRTVLQGPVPQVSAGAHVLRVGLEGANDAEPRDDARLVVVTVVPTPGVVLVASPASWESRFLLAVLRDVAALPVRGYLEITPGAFRRAGDLAPVSRDEVVKAARGADLLVALGSPAIPPGGSRPRGVLVLPVPGMPNPLPGDWYVSVGAGTPVSSALAGLAVDSFPPGTALADLSAGPADWVGLTAQAGRRGAVRPVMVGRDSGGVRRITLGLDGLWRWGFRGGSSEQGYRALVASSVSWLLGGADAATGQARPLRQVVEQGRPVTFEWVATGAPVPVPVELNGPSGAQRDTLVFDGAGRAELMLAPGAWRYRLGGGGDGVVAVEEFSTELQPRPRTLSAREATASSRGTTVPLRTWIWLFGIAVVAFAGEWVARRRLGLR
jgi:hypothetical protein